MEPGEEFDSGMESQSGSAKDVTPEKTSAASPDKASAGGASGPGGASGGTGAGGGSARAPSAGTGSSKPQEIENDIDDEPDETLSERLWGLAEMFPESVRNASNTVYDNTTSGVKGLYNLSRNALWIVFSTSIILFAPVIFEVERAQLEEMQRNQQKQLLLGPNTAMSGGSGMSLMPPMHR